MGIRDHELVDLGTWSWKDWSGFGIDVEDINLIEVHKDRTLLYEGRRVLVYIRDQWLGHDGQPRGYRYHVADCQTLQRMREQQRFGRYVATTRQDGYFVVNLLDRGLEGPVESNVEYKLEVCRNCLSELDWEGYTRVSSARRTAIRNAFSPAEFLERFGSQIGRLPAHDEYSSPLNVLPDDIWVKVRPGKTIWEALQNTNIDLEGECGGLGKCGKCKVRVLSTGIGRPSEEEERTRPTSRGTGTSTNGTELRSTS